MTLIIMEGAKNVLLGCFHGKGQIVVMIMYLLVTGIVGALVINARRRLILI